MFLETAPCFGANPLLFGADRDATVFPLVRDRLWFVSRQQV
jgi:hypothetical protein